MKIESVGANYVYQDVSGGDVETVIPDSGTVSSGNSEPVSSGIVYVQSVAESEYVDLWQSDISDLSTTDSLLLLILVVLVLQLFFKRW